MATVFFFRKVVTDFWTERTRQCERTEKQQREHSWTEIDGRFITAVSGAAGLMKCIGNIMTFGSRVPMIHMSAQPVPLAE